MSATQVAENETADTVANAVVEARRTGVGNQLVTFGLSDEEYGLDIMKVQEIILIGEITKIPQAPDYVRGLINLRGNVIPIIDLRTRFGFSPSEKAEAQRIIVLNVGEGTLGIVVDEVDQVLRVKDEDIEPPPTSVSGIDHDFIAGLVKLENKLVIVLDIEHLFTRDELKTIEQAKN